MKKKLWFLPSEVVIHNVPEDIWVIVNRKILNLTSLVEDNLNSKEILPILAFAGKDISHWFNQFGNFKTFIHPVTGLRVPYAPFGPVLHFNEDYQPGNNFDSNTKIPWWRDNKYVVGFLTTNARPLRIINSLTGFSVIIHVCEEETFYEIAERYKMFNSCLEAYSWWHMYEPIVMSKTLLGNNISDDRIKFRRLGISEDFVPSVILIYQDDCTVECQIADSMESLDFHDDFMLTSI